MDLPADQYGSVERSNLAYHADSRGIKMRVNDYSPFLDDQGEMSLAERIRGTLRFGTSWFADTQAQTTIINRFEKSLDDSFVMLRNLVLEGLDVPIPLILIGPPGIKVIYTSSLKGIYQARGEQWRVMGSNSRRFKPAKPNLQNRARLLSRAVERHLERYGVDPPPIEPLIIFSDPGIHVDTKSPAVRIVLIDALDRFAANIAQDESVLGPEQVRRITSLITDPPSHFEVEEGFKTEEDVMLRKALSSSPLPASTNASQGIDIPFLGPIYFTTRQWIVLGVLALINVFVLTAFIIIALLIA
jgi:hypothetical protein